MPQVRCVAVGTYYTPDPRNVQANASKMRGFCYLIKNEKPTSPIWVQHPRHPNPEAEYLKSSTDAYNYFAQMVVHNQEKISQALAIVDVKRVALVPIPASGTTLETRDKGRWPAREMAKALEKLGFGQCRACLVNRSVKPPKHVTKIRIPACDIAQNYEQIDALVDVEPAILVDDVITWGAHVAAAHSLLSNNVIGALAFAFNDSQQHDAYKSRWRDVEYELSGTDWSVKIADVNRSA